MRRCGPCCAANGGMIMVSDMFNNGLKSRIDGLCNELAILIADQPDLIRSGSFQSQSQGWQGQGGSDAGQQQRNDAHAQQQGADGPIGRVSLFVPPAPGTSGDWWPGDLRWPNSTGAQNGVRYAYFAEARRLAIEVNGRVTVYDTLDHQIGGFSQQQSIGGSVSFNSQYGLIDVASLPVVSSTVSSTDGKQAASIPASFPRRSRRKATSTRRRPRRTACRVTMCSRRSRNWPICAPKACSATRNSRARKQSC